MSASERYDWDAIERDYRAGVLPISAICRKHGCSSTRLRYIVKKHKWTRLSPDVAAALGFAGVTQAKGEQHTIYTYEDLKKAATLDAAGVLVVHRQDIARLRNLQNVLAERLGFILAGINCELPSIGSRETPADLLEKLSRVQVRTIELERQAFGLEAMAQNPTGGDGEVAANQVLAEMKDLMQKCDAIAAQKAAK